MSMIFLISGKFVSLLSPFILKSLVNSMMLNGGAMKTAGAISTSVMVTSSSFSFWKAGLALLLWGSTRALSTVLV